MESPESQKGQGEKCPICDSIMAVPTGLTPEIKQIIGTIIVIILVCALVLCIYSFYKGYEDWFLCLLCVSVVNESFHLFLYSH